MVNNWKKLSILLSGMVLAAFMIITVSCRHSTNASDDEQEVLVSGTIITDNLSEQEGRSAFPTEPSSVYYTVTAYLGSKGVKGRVTQSDSTISFSVPLSRGDWTIVARGYSTNAAASQDDTTLIFEGKSSIITITGTKADDANVSKTGIAITAKPISKKSNLSGSNTGTVNLPVYVPLSLNNHKVIAYWTQNVNGFQRNLKQTMTVAASGSDYRATFTMLDNDPDNAGYSAVNTSSVPVGTYQVRFEFYNSETSGVAPVYVIPVELIHVYKNLETNKWYKESVSDESGSLDTPSGSPWFSSVQDDGSASLTITDDLINSFINNTFYVKQQTTAPANPDGSFVKPFATIQDAVDKIMKIIPSQADSNYDYNICLLSDIVEDAETTSYALSNTNSGDGKSQRGTLVRIDVRDLDLSTWADSTSFSSDIKITITSGSSLIRRKIDVARDSTHTGGFFYVNGNRATGNTSYSFTSKDPVRLLVSLENLELTGAYSITTGAVVGMDNGAPKDSYATFYGAKIIMKNCYVHNNTSLGDSGGAVFIALHNTFEAENTIFENNTVNHSPSSGTKYGNGGAIYSWSGMKLNNCHFDGNLAKNYIGDTAADKSAGGALLINLDGKTSDDNLNVLISNCTFTNNVAEGAGGAVQINTAQKRSSTADPSQSDFPNVQFENVVIKNNSSGLFTGGAGGIGFKGDDNSQFSFDIKGVCTITDNTAVDASSNVYSSNVLLVDPSESNPDKGKINVVGALTGSRIGVSVRFINALYSASPTAEAQKISVFNTMCPNGITFTTNYSETEYSNPANPGEIFFSDYGIFAVDDEKNDGGQARIIARNQSSIENGFDSSEISLSIDKDFIFFNKKTYISVVAKRNGKPIPASNVDMTYRLSMYGDDIPMGTSTSGYYYCETPFRVCLSEKLPQGNFRLFVSACDKSTGNTYSAEYKLVTKTPIDITDSSVTSSSINSENIYAITNQAGFTKLASLVNSGTDFEGVNVCLENDVPLTGSITSIGSSYAFKGIFDGCNYSIIYTKETSNATLSNTSSALFANVASGTSYSAEIKNVTAKMEGQTSLTARSGLIAQATGTSSKPVIIDNCKNEVKLYRSTSNELCGGIVANVDYGVISNCKNSNELTISHDSGVVRVGGIIAQAKNSTVYNCLNSGKLNKSNNPGYVYMGGICGISENSNFYNLKNTGEIDSASNNNSSIVGGILGRIEGANNVTVFNCENMDMSVNTKANAGSFGGIIGNDAITSSNVAKIHNCINAGQVKSYTSENNVAGICYVSSTDSTIEIKNLLNTGNIYAHKSNPTSEPKGCPIIYKDSNTLTVVTQNNYYDSSKANPLKDSDYVEAYSSIPSALADLNMWIAAQPDSSAYVNWIIGSDNKPHLNLGF